jgi:hypothetical protein
MSEIPMGQPTPSTRRRPSRGQLTLRHASAPCVRVEASTQSLSGVEVLAELVTGDAPVGPGRRDKPGPALLPTIRDKMNPHHAQQTADRSPQSAKYCRYWVLDALRQKMIVSVKVHVAQKPWPDAVSVFDLNGPPLPVLRHGFISAASGVRADCGPSCPMIV